jgi:hypothetical protein
MKVIESGNYIIINRVGIGLLAYIYNNTFYPSNPYANLLAQSQIRYVTFKLVARLHANNTYALVIDVISLNNKGNFLVVAYGPNNVVFNRTGVYLY